MAMIRVGMVPYLNAFPYLYGLEQRCWESSSPLQIFFAPPATLNAQLASGQLEAALVSSIELARRPKEYVILSGLGIGTQRAARSVLLLSRSGLEELRSQAIGVTNASASGVVLLRILLERCWGISDVCFVNFSHLNEAKEQFSALLLIGDEALEARQQLSENSGKNPWRVMDLGEAWREWSGLSFVFALWAARRDWAEENAPLAVWLGNELKESVRLSQRNHRAMIQKAQKRWSRIKDVEGYLEQFDYPLGDSHWDGLVSFYQWALRLGEVESLPDLKRSPDLRSPSALLRVNSANVSLAAELTPHPARKVVEN